LNTAVTADKLKPIKGPLAQSKLVENLHEIIENTIKMDVKLDAKNMSPT